MGAVLQPVVQPVREVIMARDEELDHLLTVLEYTQRCVLMIDDMTSTDDDQASFNPVLGFYCPATTCRKPVVIES